ncbi:MAG: hypothetical protein AABX01_07065 [Candidatus Micrarchaeota archaeon]
MPNRLTDVFAFLPGLRKRHVERYLRLDLEFLPASIIKTSSKDTLKKLEKARTAVIGYKLDLLKSYLARDLAHIQYAHAQRFRFDAQRGPNAEIETIRKKLEGIIGRAGRVMLEDSLNFRVEREIRVQNFARRALMGLDKENPIDRRSNREITALLDNIHPGSSDRLLRDIERERNARAH